MLLLYPQGCDHILPIHYQSYDTSSSSYRHHSELPRSTASPSFPARLPHRSLPHSMHKPQQSSNPSVRIHHSTPSPGNRGQTNDNQLMLAHSSLLGGDWGQEEYSGVGHLETSPRQRTGGSHKRLSSDSSINTTGPPSPHDHSSTFCQIANNEPAQFSSLDKFDCASTPPKTTYPKSLPTPVDTPTSNQFMQSGYQNSTASQDNHRYASFAMRTIQSIKDEDDSASFAYSRPQSVSSMSHTAPTTPHTSSYEPEFDEKNFSRGEKMHSYPDNSMDEYSFFNPGYPSSPAFSQAMQDVFPDQRYNNVATQRFSQQVQANVPHTSSHLSPYRDMNVFASRLQAANQNHLAQRTTNSPVTSVTRERSPFNPYNTMQETGNETVSQNQMARITQASMVSKSVSPKELMLDDPELDEVDMTPLFPSQFDQPSGFPDGRRNPNLPVFRDQKDRFSTQSFSAAPATQVPQQYPFISSRQRQQSSTINESDQIPQFHTHLVSMETTVEEESSEPSSSQELNNQQPNELIERPDDTSADSGNYTCTYHGCTLRFETPAKLQKHKREAHRPASLTIGPGPTSASAGLTSLGLRNSQAGPHSCDRVNPSTGKPCHSKFSRPYDLTRHEDTIHNAGNQKVRCHLCAKDKTFSRNDALTRHMRVVHPDVDWPGKIRKGKGRD